MSENFLSLQFFVQLLIMVFQLMFYLYIYANSFPHCRRIVRRVPSFYLLSSRLIQNPRLPRNVRKISYSLKRPFIITNNLKELVLP